MHNTTLALNLFSSFFLCGLIWVIQIVHYPMFYHLEKNRFSKYIRLHGYRISFIVIPVMIIELLTSIALVFLASQYFYFHIAGLVAVSIIWLTTFFVQVPLHNQLAQIKSKFIIRKLIRTNWIRTILWTLNLLLHTG